MAEKEARRGGEYAAWNRSRALNDTVGDNCRITS